MKKTLITGGTGRLGRELVKQMLASDISLSVLTSQDCPGLPDEVTIFRGDLITGAGLPAAVEYADTVIHCASNPANFYDTDVIGTNQLLRSLRAHPNTHLIYISIVGVDRSDYPYYTAKKKAEDAIAESGIPFSILRTTQFHDLVSGLIGDFLNNHQGRLQIPGGMKFQSVSMQEVASKLIAASQSSAAGLLPLFGGPEVLTFEGMLKDYLETFNLALQWEALPLDGPRYELFRSGVNLCPADAKGEISWKTFLKTKFQNS